MRKSALDVLRSCLFAAAFACVSGACAPADREMSTNENAGAITVVTFPQPDLPIADVSPFLSAGCKPDGRGLDCHGVPNIEMHECYGSTLGVDNLISAMVPSGTAIVSCDILLARPGATGIFRVGCKAARERRYLVASQGRFRLIQTKEELAKLVQPVDTAEKALALAVAVTGAEPLYSIEMSPTRRFLVDKIETTHVMRTPAGFVVRLFETDLCGCGYHPTSAVDVLVTEAGEVRKTGAVAVYESTAEMCVD